MSEEVFISSTFLLLHMLATTAAAQKDCSEIKTANASVTSGIYTIKLKLGKCNGVLGGIEKVGSCYAQVYCDMERFGGGWTVFQKRFNGKVDFYRNWKEYEVGFGSLSAEFYAGNKFLYYFTGRKNYELLVELYDGKKKCKVYAQYASFRITEQKNYTLSLGSFKKGTAGDSLYYVHNNRVFTTYDQDNDGVSYANCAVLSRGGWWYEQCHTTNLNGEYFDGCSSAYGPRMTWTKYIDSNQYFSYKESEMKLRPVEYKQNDSTQTSELCADGYNLLACPNVCTNLTPADCSEIKLANPTATTGIYTIKLMDKRCDLLGNINRRDRCCTEVYCDMKRFGGGWTVFQKRYDGTVNFYRNWKEYETGFGSLYNEFYAGNKFLYYFTGRKVYELLVEVDQGAPENCSLYAQYSSFNITDPIKYTLSLGSFGGGTAGDSLTFHNNMAFTTYDRDNDIFSRNCAESCSGAWWYQGCHNSNLNGKYLNGCTSQVRTLMRWATGRGSYYSFTGTEMKLRPTVHTVSKRSAIDANNQKYSGKLCPPDYIFTPCPKDCNWNQWEPWTSCTATETTPSAAEGIMKRNRTRKNRERGGMRCQGEASETKVCNISGTTAVTERTTSIIASSKNTVTSSIPSAPSTISITTEPTTTSMNTASYATTSSVSLTRFSRATTERSSTSEREKSVVSTFIATTTMNPSSCTTTASFISLTRSRGIATDPGKASERGCEQKSWGHWGLCSATCGNGTQKRWLTILKTNTECEAEGNVEYQSCYQPNCTAPVFDRETKDIIAQAGIDKGSVEIGDSISLSAGVIDALPYLTAELNETTKKLVGHQLMETIPVCSYDGVQCNYQKDFKTFVDSTLGNCFTFNFMNPPKYRSYRAGTDYGLTILLQSSQREYLCTSQTAGFKILGIIYIIMPSTYLRL